MHGPVLAQTMDTVHRLCERQHRRIRVLAPGDCYGEERRRTEFYGGVPPAIHEVHARSLGQVQSDTSCFERNEEDSDFHVVHYGTSRTDQHAVHSVEGMNALKCLIVASRACGLIVPSSRQIYTNQPH